MSEVGRAAAAQPQHAAAAAPASLDALRRQGAWRLDPARFHWLEALARRLHGQPETVRRLLQPKLDAGVADYAARFAQARQAAGDEAQRLLAVQPRLAAQVRPLQAAGDLAGLRRLAARQQGGAACVPLAQLNQSLRSAAAAADAGAGPARRHDELASVSRFRRAWSGRRSQQQVEQAVLRKPANAGPLNSHALVLHSLALMRDLSPDYLRRFLAHAESLQWLEQVREQQPPPQGAAGRKAGAAKPALRRRAKK